MQAAVSGRSMSSTQAVAGLRCLCPSARSRSARLFRIRPWPSMDGAAGRFTGNREMCICTLYLLSLAWSQILVHDRAIMWCSRGFFVFNTSRLAPPVAMILCPLWNSSWCATEPPCGESSSTLKPPVLPLRWSQFLFHSGIADVRCKMVLIHGGGRSSSRRRR